MSNKLVPVAICRGVGVRANGGIPKRSESTASSVLIAAGVCLGAAPLGRIRVNQRFVGQGGGDSLDFAALLAASRFQSRARDRSADRLREPGRRK